MKTLRLMVLALAVSALASAATITYTGTTAGGPTWNRPIADEPPNSLSGVGTDTPYDVFSFSVDTNGSYTFQSTATSPEGWDNYTFLYVNSFNPLDQFTNVLIGNDDNPDIGLSGFTTNLLAGTTYLLITTGFDNESFGAFSNEISGPGNITSAVPEPSTLSLLAAGFAALAWRRRKR